MSTIIIQNRKPNVLIVPRGPQGPAGPDTADAIAQFAADTGAGLIGLLASTSTGAVATDVQTRSRQLALHPEDFGCVGDGSTDDTTNIKKAITAAATEKRWLDGRGKTYAVTGKISGSDDLWMRDITLKQLAPGASASVITLECDTLDNVRLIRVAVDRNGDGTNGGFADSAGVNGCLDTAFGIHLTGCTNGLFEDLEVYGDDTGTGINLTDLDSSSAVVRPYVHDITGVQTSGDGTDEAVQGIRVQDCTGLVIQHPRIVDMKMTYGSTTDIWGTRSITCGGLNRCIFIAPYMKNAGEAFDVSSSTATADCTVIGGIVDTSYSYGFKLAHDCRRWRLLGCKTYQTGDHGFFTQAASDDAVALGDANVCDGCEAVNPGGPSAGFIVNPSGFAATQGGEDNSIGLTCRNCRAIDNQATATMANGFYNEKTASSTCLVKYENCESYGHTNLAFSGEHEDRCHVVRNSTNQSIPNATATEITYDTELEDTAGMHSTSASTGRITIMRDGVYLVIAQVQWAANSTGTRQLFIQKGGSNITGARSDIAGNASAVTQSLSWVTQRLKAGDTLGMAVQQSSGGALNVVANANQTGMIVQRLSA